MRRSDGYVTAETAVVLPVLVLVGLLLVGVVGAAGARVRCVDAAQAGVRAVVRGEPPDAGVAAALAVAPPGARARVEVTGGRVRVWVGVEVVVGREPLRVPVGASAVGELEAG